MAGGLAIVVVVALIVLGVDYGPRSSPIPPSRGSTQPGLGTSTGGLRAVFVPEMPTSRAVLDEAAATMVARLHALGDYDTPVYIEGGRIVVRGPRFDRSELQLVAKTGAFFIRPVLCGAPPFSPSSPTASTPSVSAPVCDSPYATTASNLDMNPTTGRLNTIGPDPSLGSYPSTTVQSDDPTSTVLLPADPASGAQQFARFVLGPAQLSGSVIAAARAQYLPAEATWSVDVTLKPSAVAQWDEVAQHNFHAYLAADLDGTVLWAPLIQPQSSTFASFRGQMQIVGNFTATQARGLAALIASGPMAVRLALQSESVVSPSPG
jgi:hypothetical protein